MTTAHNEQPQTPEHVSLVEMTELLRDIHTQNQLLAQKIDAQTAQMTQIEKTAIKRGAVAGSIAGGVMAVGVELIRAKLGF